MTDNPDVGIIIDHIERIECENCDQEVDVSALEPFDKIKCPECDFELTVPGRLGQFILLELLSSGGMGDLPRRSIGSSHMLSR